MINDTFQWVACLYFIIWLPFEAISCYYELMREEDDVEGNEIW